MRAAAVLDGSMIQPRIRKVLAEGQVQVNARRVQTEALGLPAGYHTEGGKAGVYLVDPEGRRVMRVPETLSRHQRAAQRDPSLDPSGEPQLEEWQEYCRLLLEQLIRRTAAYERLRSRETKLVERLHEVESELDQANTIAEKLYEFFRNHVKDVSDQKRRNPRRGLRD